MVAPNRTVADQLRDVCKQSKVNTMKEQLLSSSRDDVLIIDDASRCILDFGVTLDTTSNSDQSHVRGFWDLLQYHKTVYLLSSVAPKDFITTIENTYLKTFKLI